MKYGFIWDDFTYILNNPSLAPGSNLSNLWSPFEHRNADFWPVTYSVFWLIRNFFGSDPMYFHALNFGLFLASVVLVYKLLTLIKVESAFLISVIFAVHPMNVSVVAWAFQAKTNLSNVFGLISVIFFILSLRDQVLKKYYLASLGFFILALLSKINLIFLPIIILSFLMLIQNRKLISSVLISLPYFVVSLVLGLTNTFWDAGALPTPESEMILDPSFIHRYFLIGKNFIFYFYKTFIPTDLMFSYKKAVIDYSNLWDILPSIFLTLFLVFCGYKIFTARRLNTFYSGIIISFILLFPVLGLVEIYYMRFSSVAEHYLSIAMIGFLFAVLSLIKNKKFHYACFVFPVVLSYQTFRYLPEYSDEETVMLKTIDKNSDSILAHNLLGSLYKNKGDFKKAIDHYQKSIEIKPTAQPYFNLATVQEKIDLWDQARANYEKSIELNPYYAPTYVNLGGVYLKLNKPLVAINYFKKSLEKNRNYSPAFYNIGYTYEFILKDAKESYKWYLQALQISPQNSLFKNAVQRTEGLNQ